jgi:hypothetical protein
MDISAMTPLISAEVTRTSLEFQTLTSHLLGNLQTTSCLFYIKHKKLF